MINKCVNGVEFEAFELSPSDSAVMKTSGRLRRCFPGPSLLIDEDQFSNTGLQSVLTKTLSKLSVQTVPGITDFKGYGDFQDTQHPGLVTELIVAFLQPIGQKGSSKRIWKHTREDVLCKKGGPPWRRSPLWLLIRVVMQILFTRHSDSGHHTGRYYKLCTLYILANVLNHAALLDQPHSLPPDVLHCMSAKIVRRMIKLDAVPDEPGVLFVQAVLQKTKTSLEQKWSLIQVQTQEHFDFSSLPRLQFIDDVSIALPSLDEFLSSLATRERVQIGIDVTITRGLQYFAPRSFPALRVALPPEYLPYNLERFETWVASHLSACLRRMQPESDTCVLLEREMRSYHTAAMNLYTANPEAISVMILTLLELWIGCDKMAVHKFPLLRDYDPQIPMEVFQSLLLSTKGQLSRLRKIERYVEKRRDDASLSAMACVFQGFGTAETFSVRYFDSSVRLQSLFRQIKQNAETKRLAKLEELRDAKREYTRLMGLYHAEVCQTVSRTTQTLRGESWVEESYLEHKEPCVRCTYKQEAEAMRIDVFEWPLPSDTAQAKSVVFELDVPHDLSCWRDSTMFLLMEVLGQEYATSEPSRKYTLTLSSNLSLSDHFKINRAQRLNLISPNPPNAPKTEKVDTWILPSKVCIDSGLQFRYFDTLNRRFVRDLIHSDDVVKPCTYRLPSQSNALQKFMLRNFNETDSTPNEIIAIQSSCPAHISLAEYRGLAAIPTGYHLQWMSILVQLACPTVDIRKVEATFMFLQAIYQAGPASDDDDGFRRLGHSVIGDEAFVIAILSHIKDAAARITSNWESSFALGIIVSITARIHSLAPSSQVQGQALGLLAGMRQTAFEWTKMLREKSDEFHERAQKAHLLEKLVFAALVCIGTFDIDLGNLKTVLLDPIHASIFLNCGIILHEYRSQKQASTDRFHWRRSTSVGSARQGLIPT